MKREKIIKHFLLIILFIITIPVTTSCWDVRTIEETGFILSAGIDPDNQSPKSEKHYIYTISSPLFVETAESNVEVLSTSAKTPMDAFDYFNKVGGRRYIADHLQVLLINAEVAKEGNLLAKLDMVYRDPRVSTLAYIIITTDPAYEILNTIFKDKDRIAVYLSNLLESVGREGSIAPIHLHPQFRQMAMDAPLGKDAIAPVIGLVENGVNIEGIAVFQGDKMVGMLEGTEVGTFIILSRFGTPSISYEGGENRYTFITRHIKRKIIPYITEGIIGFNIEVDLELMLNESFNVLRTDITDGKIKADLEARVAEFVKGEFQKTINKLKNLNSDPIGLGKRFRAKYPDLFSEIDWREYYPYIDVNFDVSVNITRHGLIN